MSTPLNFCKKCNNYHPEDFFDLNSNKTRLRKTCILHRLRKNKKEILTIINTEFDPTKYWYEQLPIIIKLYSVGMQYQQFANIFNTNIQLFINYFISIDLKFCTVCRQLKSRIEFSNHKSLNDGIISKCKQCYHTYNKQPNIKQLRQIRNKSEEHRKYDKEYHQKHQTERNLYLKQYSKKKSLFDTYSQQISFCESVRRDPKNLKHLQVKCYLSSCQKWYNPTNQQIQKRIYSLSGNAPIGEQNNLYCSEQCKKNCLTYKQKNTLKSNKKIKSNTRDLNYHNQLKTIKLNEQFEKHKKYLCEKCNIMLEKNELILHHISPVVLDPIEAFDKDNVILICKECDNIIHNSINCNIGTLVKEGIC